MSLQLELSKELEASLSQRATRAGMPLSDYALQVLKDGQIPHAKIRNGSALVAYWKSAGVVGCRADIKNSARHARVLRRKAEIRLPKARARR